jgi:hypothetical protein
MEKLIFLLILAVAFFGIMPAFGAAHPSGVFTLNTVLSENSVHEAVVTLDTVLATQDFFSLPASILALPDMIAFTGQPHGYLIKPMAIVSNEVDYWLRL